MATRCEESDCPLHDYRTGHRPRGRKAKLTPLKALRAYCLDCCIGQAVEVRLCPSGAPPLPCPLWPWRKGRSRTGERPPENRPAPREMPSAASNSPARPPALVSLPTREAKGPTAHTLASMRCQHFYGGWCKLDGLPADPKLRADCRLIDGTGACGWAPCRDCRKARRKPGFGRSCRACEVMHTTPCAWFEEHLLPQANEATRADYLARTAPWPDSC